MKFSSLSVIAMSAAPLLTNAFTASSCFLRTPASSGRSFVASAGVKPLQGYLDDLTQYTKVEEEPEPDYSREATNLKAEQKDRFGVGDWSGYVEFQEFDGGDGKGTL